MGLADRLRKARALSPAFGSAQALLTGGYTVRDWVPPRTGPNGLELHAPLANYEGPRTDVIRRVREGVKPTSYTDAAAKKHDIQYHNIGVQLAKGQITRAQAIQQIKSSDNKLMKSALTNKLSINPVEHMHANLAMLGIGGKKVMQGVGALDELKFVDPKDGDLLEGGRRKAGRKPNLVKGLARRFKKS